MCGVAGLVGAGVGGFASFMEKALAHRGPDCAVTWGGRGIELVQTRLAINDLSEGGVQPFHSHGGRFTVVYNGEIYNDAEIRTQYRLDGISPCDGAVIPEMWARRGPECLEDLRGMYAICVFDNLTSKTWLAVDPLGMKTLYTVQSQCGVAFASEAVPLANFFGRATVEPHTRAVFEAWGCLPEGRSGVSGIDRMAPGEVREFDATGHEVARSSVQMARWRRRATRWTDVVEAFVESVDLHLRSDVPLGLMLSAGVDSAAVAWAAAAAGRRLNCYTLDFAGSPGEGPEAARIARAYGHPHEVITADPDIGSVIANYLGRLDRPTCDGLNVYIMSSIMRSSGLKVALTGTGGDEVLAGYPHHSRRVALPHRLNRAAQIAARRSLGVAGAIERPQARRGARIRPALERLLHGLHGTARGALAFEPGISVAGQRAQHPDYGTVEATFQGPDLNQLSSFLGTNEYTQAEWSHYLAPMLLADADVFSMAFGLELRLPFVDVAVVAAAMQVEGRTPGKGPFVAATGDPILREVAARPKTGFNLPMGRWLGSTPISLDSEELKRERVLPHVPETGPRAQLSSWKDIVFSAWTDRIRDDSQEQDPP